VTSLARGRGYCRAVLSCILAKAKIVGLIDAPGRPRISAERQAVGAFELDKANDAAFELLQLS
jgi:hypothetical protein